MQKSVPVYSFSSRFPLQAESDALRSKCSCRSDQQLHRVICPENQDDFHRMFNFNIPAVRICIYAGDEIPVWMGPSLHLVTRCKDYTVWV